MLNSELRTVDEAYATSCTTSDLRVEADRRGDADLLIAAGMSPTRMGSALLRLHSEFDRAEKPKKPTKAQIEALFQILRDDFSALGRQIDSLKEELHEGIPDDQDGSKTDRLNRLLSALKLRQAAESPQATAKALSERAKMQAWSWYIHELELLMSKLKTLPEVRAQAVHQAKLWNLKDPESMAPEVLGWWLFQICPVCHGTKWQAIAGTGRLSAKECRACHGTGITPVPHGQEGRRLASYFDLCVQRARGSIKDRLRNYRP